MAVKGQATKNRLMDIAERLILNNGFAAMSIDDVIGEAGITKGGFFYHYESKHALAYALMQRYRQAEAFTFSELFKRSEELTSDPLQQMLVFIKLFAESMSDIEGVHPGCLVASTAYESHQLNEQVKNITAEIELEASIEARTARAHVPGLIDSRAEPIKNPVTGFGVFP